MNCIPAVNGMRGKVGIVSATAAHLSGLTDCTQPVADFGMSKVANAGRIQPVSATQSLNISAGVWKPSVLRGLSFNFRAIALS